MSQFHKHGSRRGKVLPANRKPGEKPNPQHHKKKSLSNAIVRRGAIAIQVIIEELKTPGYEASEGDLISVVRKKVRLHEDRVSALIQKLVNSHFLIDVAGVYRRGVRIFRLKTNHLNSKFKDLCREIYRKIFGFHAQRLQLV